MGTEDHKTFFASAERSDEAELKKDIALVCKNPIVAGLLQTVSGLLAVLNSQRQILALNDTLLESLGISNAEEAFGLRPGEAFHCVHSHEMPGGCGTSQYCSTCGAAIAIVSSLTSKTPQEKKCVVTTMKNGSTHDVCFRVKACPLRLDNNNTYILLFLQDITKEEWRASIERVFFHDLNNIIGGLVGISDLMTISKEKHHLFSPLQHLIQRLHNEVKVQALLSSSDTAGYNITLGHVCVDDLTKELIDIFMSHPATRNKVLKISSDPTNISLETDRALLLRILVNMLKNAFEAAEKDEVIRFWVEADRSNVIFSTWNKQPIPPDVALRVFQRHFSTKDEEGRGLGTYSMKLFGEHFLKGKVDFISSPAEGTTFFIKLPISSLDS